MSDGKHSGSFNFDLSEEELREICTRGLSCNVIRQAKKHLSELDKDKAVSAAKRVARSYSGCCTDDIVRALNKAGLLVDKLPEGADE